MRWLEHWISASVLLFLKFLQHVWFDVATTDDGDVEFCPGEFRGVEDETGGSDSSTGFGYGLRISAQVLRRRADFVFRDGDDVVDVSADVFEVDGADALRAESVGDGARDLLGGELDDLALAQTGLGVGGEFGFDSDHFDLGIR